MTFLPIVDRELRVRARAKGTFRVRVGGALVACLIIAFFLVMTGWWFSPSKTGQAVFWFLTTLAFIWCVSEGPRNTADALSEEKRDGTLGLLFLTDLKPYDVVLGKLLATSLNSIYGVLAILPPLSIPLLLGGVTVGEFWRVVLLLLVTLLFSLSVGMLISAASRDERRAWFGTAALVAFLVAVPPLLRWLPIPTTEFLAWCSPGVGFISWADAVFARHSDWYWQSIAGAHALTWAFLVAACLVLPQSWQDKPVQKANRETTAAGRLQREVARVPVRRTRLMHQNPVVWMLTRGKGPARPVWIIVLVTTLPALAAALIWEGASFLVGPFAVAAVLVHLVIAIWVSAQACFLMADARNSGALELLLTTPLHPHQIVKAHIDVLQQQFLAPVGVLCFLEGAIVLNFLGFNSGKMGGGVEFVMLFVVVVFGVFAADLLAVAWFGLWMGLANKKSGHAVVKTISYVLVLPLIGSFFCCWLAPITLLIKDLVFFNYGRTRLRQQFRNMVTEGVTRPIDPWTRPAGWPAPLPNVLEK